MIKKNIIKQDNKTLLNSSIQQGRPKKFKHKLDTFISIGFTKEHINLIDNICKELNYTVRVDYIRQLILKDIHSFKSKK